MPAAPFTGNHKFLVFLFKDGGEDSYNTVMSRDPARIAELVAARPSMTFSETQVNDVAGICKDTLLNSDYAMTPNYLNLMSMWTAGEMAVVFRVGSMFTPLFDKTRAQIQAALSSPGAGGIILPVDLGAHDRQSLAFGTQVTVDYTDDSSRAWMRKGSGFGGRLAERFDGLTGSSNLPLMHRFGRGSIFSNFWKNSQTAQNINVPNLTRPFTLGTGTFPTQLLARLDAITAAPPAEIRDLVSWQAYNNAKASTAFYGPICTTARGAGGPLFSVDASFAAASGNSSEFQNGLLQVARAIEKATDTPPTGLPLRTAFCVSGSGFDTHALQGLVTTASTTGLTRLQLDYAKGLSEFVAAMKALGVWNDVLIVDCSEFGRAIRQNGGDGSDHGWAGTRFYFGGQVRGNGVDGSTGIFGQFPAVLGFGGAGSDDVSGGVVGSGSLTPSVSWEQFLEPALRWFGCDNDDIAEVLPRLHLHPASPDLML